MCGEEGPNLEPSLGGGWVLTYKILVSTLMKNKGGWGGCVCGKAEERGGYHGPPFVFRLGSTSVTRLLIKLL